MGMERGLIVREDKTMWIGKLKKKYFILFRKTKRNTSA
jgi:hypothetical protein